ncbi:Ig-like domain-containing protein [Mycolicibacterium sp. XJ2546]
MKSSHVIGRVGGLAVALGVGAAVSLGSAAAAWADDTGSAASGEAATSAAGTSQTDDTAGAQDASAITTTTTTTTTDDDPTASTDADGDGSADRAGHDFSTPMGELVRRVPRGLAISTGGAHTSKSGPKGAALDDATEESATATREPVGRSNTRQKRLEVVGTQDEDADVTAVVRPAQRSWQEISPPQPDTVADDADTAVVEKEPVAFETTTLPVAPVKVVTQTISAADTAPSDPPSPLSTVVLAALARTGWAPLTPNSPAAPRNSPLEMALLALGARPRPFGSSPNGQIADEVQTLTAAAAPRFVNKPSIPVGVNPSGVVIGPDGRMFVANTGSGTVSVINTETGQRIDASPTSSSMDIRVGAAPSALALSLDGKRLYVANTASGTVSVVDTVTYMRVDANPSAFSMDIKVGAAPIALAFGSDGRLYVANRGSKSVSVINTTTNTLVDTNPNAAGVQSISVGSSPSALAASPDGRLYVANRASNTVSVINTANFSVTATVAVGKQPSSVALGADGKVYVANTGSNTVSVINTAGVQHISVGPAPSSAALSPDGAFAYVANANGTVSVIDTTTSTLLSTVAIDTDRTGGHVVAVGAGGTVYIADAADRTVRVLVRQGNAAPQSGTPTVGTPDTATGAVSGALNFTDADGDTLSYSVTQPSSGTVTITSTGTYTYTPTQAAREQATQTPGRESATFVVNANDGEATATVTVTVPVAPLSADPGGPPIDVSLPGTPSGIFANTDRTHAVITSYAIEGDGSETTWAAVVNLVTGDQIGNTITLPGFQAGTVVTNDGTRALIVTYDADATRGVVIDLATGTQKGTTLTFAGVASVLAFGDGTQALITTADADTTRIMVINTLSGTQTGPTTVLAGGLASAQLSPDGSHALLSGSTRDENTGIYTTRIAVINLATGAQKGTTLTFTGESSTVLPVTANADHVLLSLNSYDGRTSTNAMRVRVINTATGAQIGNGLVLTGHQALGGALVSPDGSRAVFSTSHTTSTTNTTSVAVINTATGNQVGNTLTFSGYGYMQMSDDGSRVVVATTGKDGNTQVAVVNTAAGSAVRTTLPGGVWREPAFSADGTRVLVNTVVYRLFGNSYTTRLTVFNTGTGKPVGLAVAVAGRPISTVSTPDGTRAVIVTATVVNVFTSTYRVVAINTTTGRQVGTTLTFSGAQPPTVELSADGSKALITTFTNGVPEVTVMRIV